MDEFDLSDNEREFRDRRSRMQKRAEQLFTFISASDVGAVRQLLARWNNGDGYLDPNCTYKGTYALEKAYFSSPEMLVALLEAGAATQLPPGAPPEEQTTLLTINPDMPEQKQRADILMAAGARLTERDRQNLSDIKRLKHYAPKVQFYVETMAAAEQKFAAGKKIKASEQMPTPETIQQAYYLNLDLEKRAESIRILASGEPPAKPEKPPKPEKPKKPEKPVRLPVGTKRGKREQHILDSRIVAALDIPHGDRYRRMLPQFIRALEAGAAPNSDVGGEQPHSLLFYAADSDSKYNIPVIDLLWALGGRLNESDAEFFNIVRGAAETDNPELQTWAEKYPKKRGAQHLYELVTGTVQPTVESVCAEYQLSLDLRKHLKNRPHQSAKAAGNQVSQIQHQGYLQYNEIAAAALAPSNSK